VVARAIGFAEAVHRVLPAVQTEHTCAMMLQPSRAPDIVLLTFSSGHTR
jgi:hypothetical protein